MKKILIFTLALAALLLLASCGNTGSEGDESSVSIVTTVFPQYDFAKKITEGTGAQLSMLLSPGSEAHSYDPTPADMIAATECDLFIWVGGESEAWAEKIISSASLDGERVLALMDTVPLLETESGHGSGAGEEHVHTDGEEHDHEHDEHVWTSPKNAVIIVNAITERLCTLDPENSQKYRSNAAEYITELTALDSEFEALAEKLGGKTLIFGDRFPFLYMAKAYGLEYSSPFRGCSSDTEASMSEIASVIDLAAESNTKVIFSVDFSNEKLAATIADETDAKVCRLYSCHTVSADDFKDGIGYVELMRKNILSLEEALKN